MGFDYDLFVIGGGSGGVARWAFGVIRGWGQSGAGRGIPHGRHLCDPWLCAQKADGVCLGYTVVPMRMRGAYGWSDAQIGTFDWTKFSGKMNAELDRLEGIYRTNLAKAGVEIFNARAEMVDAHTVKLSSGETFTAKHILNRGWWSAIHTGI